MDNIKKSQIEYLNSPITVLKGIGPKKSTLFSKLGIYKVWDLVYNFPAGYEDRRKFNSIESCVPGELCCIKIRPLRQIVERRLKQKLSLFLLYGSDGHDNIVIKWFSAPFSKPKIKSGHLYNVYGMLSSQNGRKEFEMRYIEDETDAQYTGVIVPVYRATAGLTPKTVSETVRLALGGLSMLEDCIPEEIRARNNLINIYDAVKTMHCPSDFDSLSEARNRLAFEELFILCLALASIKERRVDKKSIMINATPFIKEYALKLPFELTDGQKQSLNEICADLKSGKPMNRLVQGDVGCGKTAVAAAVLYAFAMSGYQSAFMAPTEILAHQHYVTLQNLLGNDVKIALFTSSVKDKKRISEEISNGNYDIIVGTHALIEDKITFSNLALCITDEQHRFGVNQRATLSSKGESCHILVMSATPIPRTLSLILYGDLDISIIKTMPKGRQIIDTFHIDPSKRERAYKFVKKEVMKGHQCYVVCPLVEDSEAVEAASVESTLASLKNGILSGLRVECVHGKMKADEKDRIMNLFKSGSVDVLISTTVIEVGVDVPNATVMLVENAERFGLSQLHQLRGRVGRGENKSYCILISDCTTDNCKERMKIMTESTDGFVISQKDLELRGSGQFFGTRQHGVPELKVANLFSDGVMLQKAVDEAYKIIGNDPMLVSPSISIAAERIRSLFESFEGKDIFN